MATSVGRYIAQDQNEPPRHIHGVGTVRNSGRHLLVSHYMLEFCGRAYLCLCSYIFLEVDAGKRMVKEESVKTEAHKLLSRIKSHLTGIARVSML